MLLVGVEWKRDPTLFTLTVLYNQYLYLVPRYKYTREFKLMFPVRRWAKCIVG